MTLFVQLSKLNQCEKGEKKMMELRKIDEIKFKSFVNMRNARKKISHKMIMRKLEMDKEEYDFYESHHSYIKGLSKKKKPAKTVIVEQKIKNIQNGRSGWLDDLLGVR